MTSREVLRLADVSAGYSKAAAIHGIDMILHAGDTLAVVGANGAGKSTLLRAIMGQIPLMQGEILFDAAPLSHLETYRRARLGIGYAPEGRQLFPDMIVEETLELGASRETRLERRRRIERMLEIFPKLQPLRRTRCGLLSGGEQQMVAIGRALMGEPRLLVLDEPSTGLAPRVISELYTSLRSLLVSGLTVLVAEQNARAALRFARHAIIFEDGRIVARGLARDLAKDERIVEAYFGLSGEANPAAGRAGNLP